jgi:hypothetical protein
LGQPRLGLRNRREVWAERLLDDRNGASIQRLGLRGVASLQPVGTPRDEPRL